MLIDTHKNFNKTSGYNMKIVYTVVAIMGDYALCRGESGTETEISRALLPLEVDEGDKVLFNNGIYEDITVKD